MASEDVKVKLYWLNESRAQRIVWLLEELEIPYDVEVFQRNKETFLAPPELEKVHPLGKSPVVTVTPSGGEPIVLAETGFIISYLCEHFPKGKALVPAKWKPGMEGKVGGETEEWMRYEYFLHYTEGSLMPFLVMALVMTKMKTGAPFFVRPIVNMIADRVLSSFVAPNLKRHFKFLEQQLATSPGEFLCGANLTAADIDMSYPLVAGETRLDAVASFDGGSWKGEFPKVAAYLEKLKAQDGFKKCEEKIRDFEAKGSAKI